MQSFGVFSRLTPVQLMPLRYIFNTSLWATCEMSQDTEGNCTKNLQRFLPLMGIDPRIVKTNKDSAINVADGSYIKSRYVCSSTGAAGIGMINDHGMKLHGVMKEDYAYSFNVGKGALFRSFRNFMMDNIGLDASKPTSGDPPYVITISMNSTDDDSRMTSFESQIRAIEAMLVGNDLIGKVHLRTIIFKDYPLKDQVRMVQESAVMIGVCGGGAVTNMFLSEGAGMILYYLDVNNRTKDERYKYPARLDWDYFNNAGNMRVHWLPYSTMNDAHDLELLKALLLDEIDLISGERS